MRKFLTPFLTLLLLLAACKQAEIRPIPPLERQPPSAAALQLLAELKELTAPPRDLAELTQRLKGTTVNPTISHQSEARYSVGDTATFWYKNQNNGQNIQIKAELYYASAEIYMWFEEGLRVRQRELDKATAFLENQLLPTHRAFFGEENRPGIDGDRQVHILHLREIGGIAAAYFYSADGYPQAVNPYSNEREILYISMNAADLGSDAYFGSVAQELQHLIQQHNDPNEAAWLNEGLSELALHLNGLEPDREAQYAAQTDIPLTNISYEPDVVGAHYAAGFLFTNYFQEQFGQEATQTLARHELNGLQSFEAVLAALNTGLTVDQFFANWLVANYLTGSGRTLADFSYETVAIPALELAASHRRFPISVEASVAQYGADYIQIRTDEPLTLTFIGSRRVALLDTTAHSGSGLWSTLPADKSDLTLTGRFDLSNVTSANLSFWTWYEIEAGWDYAYLTISTDAGASWQLLATDGMSRDNPQGNSFGPGFTGNSGGGERPVWIQQEVDLTPFTGGEILLRFEYVTDDAIHLAGLAIDDVTIEAIGFHDEMEEMASVWQAAGFIHHTNHLPQRYILQLIYLSEAEVRVESLALADDQRGSWTITLDEEVREAILIVAANTPVTQLPAPYHYTISRAE